MTDTPRMDEEKTRRLEVTLRAWDVASSHVDSIKQECYRVLRFAPATWEFNPIGSRKGDDPVEGVLAGSAIMRVPVALPDEELVRKLTQIVCEVTRRNTDVHVIVTLLDEAPFTLYSCCSPEPSAPVVSVVSGKSGVLGEVKVVALGGEGRGVCAVTLPDRASEGQVNEIE